MLFRPIRREDVLDLHAPAIKLCGVEPDEARLIPVIENGESLVSASPRISRHNVYEKWEPGNRWDMVRQGVAVRLDLAASFLPRGFSIVLLNGYRSRAFQSVLLSSYFSNSANAGAFVSDPADTELRAPHTTGGAVDISLGVNGNVLELGTAFDEFSQLASLRAYERDATAPEREGRRILADAMVRAGFAPYASEWWHWSFGDQFWAATYAQPHALYDTVD